MKKAIVALLVVGVIGASAFAYYHYKDSGPKFSVNTLQVTRGDVVDTVGAGDAFFAIAALAAQKKLPIELSTFLGQLAGAQAVKIVGNEHPISKQVLLKSGMSLLNF